MGWLSSFGFWKGHFVAELVVITEVTIIHLRGNTLMHGMIWSPVDEILKITPVTDMVMTMCENEMMVIVLVNVMEMISHTWWWRWSLLLLWTWCRWWDNDDQSCEWGGVDHANLDYSKIVMIIIMVTGGQDGNDQWRPRWCGTLSAWHGNGDDHLWMSLGS